MLPGVQVLLKTLKSQAAWKPVLARLKLLSVLIPVLGIGARGLPPEGLMKFAGQAMGSSNADTRAAALAVAVQVGPHGCPICWALQDVSTRPS